MFKRSITVGLFSFVCLAVFACEDGNHQNNDSACEALKCDQIVGGKVHICAMISGQASCKEACLGTDEGTNQAVCYSNESLPPESRPVYSAVDNCAKDDNGKLYSVSIQQDECTNGCNAETGNCNTDPEHTCEELNCGAIAGDGITHICATIDSKVMCKNGCLGTIEGENPAICFSNGSLPPDSRKFYTFVDTCAKDDNGQLYSVSAQMTECLNGCYDNGECK